jgi:AcrR family transcriptional regulator
MNRPNGQSEWTTTKRDDSIPTRQRLLDAAAALIAELGWSQVTTRAIAERAGLPHGTVSYHFRGKQELLTEAALHTIEHLFPMNELEAITTLEDLLHVSLIEPGAYQTNILHDPNKTEWYRSCPNACRS